MPSNKATVKAKIHSISIEAEYGFIVDFAERDLVITLIVGRKRLVDYQ